MMYPNSAWRSKKKRKRNVKQRLLRNIERAALNYSTSA